ncbi:putative phosphatidylserine decarboxylase [Metarhizium anisopliae]
MALHQVDPLVQDFINVVNGRQGWKKNFETAITTARERAEEDMNRQKIYNLPDFFRYVNDFLHWVPRVDGPGDEVLQKLCVFYWVFEQPSVRDYQSELDPDNTSGPLTFMSYWLVNYAQQMGSFLDRPESLTTETLETFYENPKYNDGAAQWLEPRGGWKSFNQFFARHLKPGSRPIAAPNNAKVIVMPADSTFDNWADIVNGVVTFPDGTAEVKLKGISWKVSDLLQDSDYRDRLQNGVFMHSFLSTNDYHRQHACVGGKVLEVKNIQGQVYLEVDVSSERGGGLVPIRPLPLPRRPSGPGSGPERGIVPPDRAGYQWCQTRGLVVIDGGDVGFVAILPIGMAQVSSVVMTAQAGTTLAKGDEISHFQFGGSDVVVVFEKHVTFVENPSGRHFKMGEKIATFN